MKSLREKIALARAARAGLLTDVRGLSTVEYVIILVLIASVALGTWKTFGSTVNQKLSAASGAYSTTVDPSAR